MKYFKIAMFFSLVFFFASCEDFFDQTTTVDIPPHTPQLGVTALWLNEGGGRLVTVFASVGVLEDESSSAVSGAEITLTENGDPLVTFAEDSSVKGFYRPVSSITLIPGNKYELTVSATNFETVKATQIMPNLPTIKDASFEKANNKLQISISDGEGDDFYVIGMTPADSSSFASSYIYDSGSLADESGLDYRRVILKDETFAGEDVSQTFEAYLNGSTSVDSVKVNLFNVSSDYYRLDRTYAASDNADGNPFAEPVILHRNFDNGYGVFALGNKSSKVVAIE